MSQDSPRHLVVVIHAMLPGGAEKVASVLINAWAAGGWRVSLVTFDDGATPPFYALDGRVRHVALGISAESANPVLGLARNLNRVRVVRGCLRRLAPDLVLSLLDRTNITVLIASLGLGIPVFAAEHTDPELAPLPRAWAWLRRMSYARARAVVVLNDRARRYFTALCKAPVRIIPNPVVVSDEPAAAPAHAARRTLVSMGRFTAEKRFDLLLRAFARVAGQFPDWDLHLLGDGPLREELQTLSRQLGVDSRVVMPGYVADPHKRLRGADLYVCSSRVEGFPCALTEAMACGLAVISTRYHSGVTEIVDDGVNGVLVAPDDEDALAAALARLMGDGGQRARLARNAASIGDRYGLAPVLVRWDVLFDELAGRAHA